MRRDPRRGPHSLRSIVEPMIVQTCTVIVGDIHVARRQVVACSPRKELGKGNNAFGIAPLSEVGDRLLVEGYERAPRPAWVSSKPAGKKAGLGARSPGGPDEK